MSVLCIQGLGLQICLDLAEELHLLLHLVFGFVGHLLQLQNFIALKLELCQSGLQLCVHFDLLVYLSHDLSIVSWVLFLLVLQQ